MKKDITIVTSLVGAGLEQEYNLLKSLLESYGHYVVGVHYTNPQNSPMMRSDIVISLEVICPPTLALSRNQWLVPNSEWWNGLNDRYLPQITKVLCKTRDCYRIWCDKVGAEKCVYTSFEARDIYLPEISRENKFLHIAGKSEHKNTDAVCRAWRMTSKPGFKPLYPLTIVARAPIFINDQLSKFNPFPYRNVTHIQHATDEEIIQLMNSHKFHIIPSMYEGFGHVIHEGLGCGAVVLTTDAAPMNSYEGIWKSGLIPVNGQKPRALAKLNEVSPQDVRDACCQASLWGWDDSAEYKAFFSASRAAFLSNRDFFRKTFMDLVDD